MIRLPGDRNFWPARPLPYPHIAEGGPRLWPGRDAAAAKRAWPQKMADCRHQYGAIAALQLFYADYILAFICI